MPNSNCQLITFEIICSSIHRATPKVSACFLQNEWSKKARKRLSKNRVFYNLNLEETYQKHTICIGHRDLSWYLWEGTIPYMFIKGGDHWGSLRAGYHRSYGFQ